jgi:hypothetical protein
MEVLFLQINTLQWDVISSGNNSYLNLSMIALMISLIMIRMIDRMNRPIIAIKTISRLSNIIGLVKV